MKRGIYTGSDRSRPASSLARWLSKRYGLPMQPFAFGFVLFALSIWRVLIAVILLGVDSSLLVSRVWRGSGQRARQERFPAGSVE
ncbi:hypothetical protein A4X13_0g6521 [Tilletia indica]|uniref:Uncharacterized protein n=1 Tax=Tilletia indica TaxID=43049 RepID=A0A177T7Q0_9BASI|nr:hypothetical protein A4X13_0g6521 [Tilletia indica]